LEEVSKEALKEDLKEDLKEIRKGVSKEVYGKLQKDDSEQQILGELQDYVPGGQ
jgi:predicted site-specific integrase-resolvase